MRSLMYQLSLISGALPWLIGTIGFAAFTSHFHARPAFVWLPPIWFSHPHPRLPALELVAGAPSFPGDWLRGAGALDTLNSYARTHHGWGPIAVVADQNGSFLGDTEC